MDASLGLPLCAPCATWTPASWAGAHVRPIHLSVAAGLRGALIHGLGRVEGLGDGHVGQLREVLQVDLVSPHIR